MITTVDLRRIITNHQIVPVAFDELGEDTPITLDSLNLVWLLHVLEEELGIIADPYDDDLKHFTSVRGILRYLTAAESANDMLEPIEQKGLHQHANQPI
jgi:hypothetical protein